MQAISLKATEREVLGKKVKQLRRDGFLPGHVYGKGVATEHVSVSQIEFLKVLHQAGETGLVELKIGEEKIRPVLIRGVQVDPVKGHPLHIDFYQVDLKQKVTVPVPIILEGDEPELVHTGEAVVIQPLTEVEIEALPTNIPEHLVVNISSLKQIDDAIHLSQINLPEGVTLILDPESVVVKLDNAVTEEMKKLMEEQAAEAAAAVETQAEEAGAVSAEAVEDKEGTEDGEPTEAGVVESGEVTKTETPEENPAS